MTKSVVPDLGIRCVWLVLLALAAQLIVIFIGFGEAGTARRFVFPASYVALAAFVLVNWRSIGLLIIGVGAFLNFIPIVANGGLMPISPATMMKTGRADELAELSPGDAVPLSKNVLLEEGETRFYWLSDRLSLGSPGDFPVFSVGDIVIAVGLVVFIATLVMALLPLTGKGRPYLT